jgi:hypothetical protein
MSFLGSFFMLVRADPTPRTANGGQIASSGLWSRFNQGGSPRQFQLGKLELSRKMSGNDAPANPCYRIAHSAPGFVL